jgi:hypothetical protein
MTDIDGHDYGQAMARLFGSCAMPTGTQPAMPATDPDLAPCAETARAAADSVVLGTGDFPAVRGEVLRIYAAGQRRPVTDLTDGRAVEDVDVVIDSMMGVFVFSVIADVLGPQGIATVRGNGEPGDFTSVDSLARLVCRLRTAVVTS